MRFEKKVVILTSGMQVNYKQWSRGSKDQETASFHNEKNNLCNNICLPASNCLEHEHNHLKEGEEPVTDDQAAGLGSGQVLPAASSSTSNDEGDAADALLQIATKV